MSSLAHNEHVKGGLELCRIEKRTFRWLSSAVLHGMRQQMAEPRPVGRNHKEGRFQLIIIESFATPRAL